MAALRVRCRPIFDRAELHGCVVLLSLKANQPAEEVVKLAVLALGRPGLAGRLGAGIRALRAARERV